MARFLFTNGYGKDLLTTDDNAKEGFDRCNSQMDGCPGGENPHEIKYFEGFVNILLGWSEPILSAKVADFQMWDKILQDDLLIKVGHFFYSPSVLLAT